MHDQSVSRVSGRTRAAVSAMCVRALRITVLKSAGNFTRDECHDLNAEKIQRVKCFMFTRSGICCVLAIFERRRGRLGSKISGYGQIGGSGSLLRHVRHPGSRHQSEGSACPLGALIRTSRHNVGFDQIEEPLQQVATTAISVGACSGRQNPIMRTA